MAALVARLERAGSRGVAAGGLIAMGVTAFLLRVPAVEIDAAHPRFCFEIGSIRKRIPLAQIVDARPARDRWLYGRGICRTPHGWLYHHMPGLEAVEIAPTSGKRLRPGTAEPRWPALAVGSAREDARNTVA